MSTSTNKSSVIELVRAVSPFFPKSQLKLLIDTIFDHEAEDWENDSRYFIGILQTFDQTFANMPKTYDTEPIQSDDDEDETNVDSDNNFAHTGEAIVYLHYFSPGCDWWIIEKDINAEQEQAFGVVKLNGSPPEFGYIDLSELIEINLVELDFHWQPTKLKNIADLEKLFADKDNLVTESIVNADNF